MTEPGEEIAFRWLVRREQQSGRWWLVVPFTVGRGASLAMVPNTVANRSVITPPAFRRLRASGLTGADLIDFRTGRQEYVLRNVRLAGLPVPDFGVQVRDVEPLRMTGKQYLVDGYLGIDVLFGLFSSLAIDTRTLWVTVRLR